MKNIKEMLDAVIEPIKLGGDSGFSNFLTEESDFEGTRIITEEDDPFGSAGGDMGGGDAGGFEVFVAVHTGYLFHNVGFYTNVTRRAPGGHHLQQLRRND